MQWAATTLAVCGLGAAALATSMLTLGRRLELSQAKHRSLAGHARMARRLAGFVPFYDYDEDRFFASDGAPADIAGLRRAGFFRLSELYKTRFAETIRCSAEAAETISDLQFTGAYRVPFQYRRMVRAHLPLGAFLQSSEGVTVTDLDGNRFYDLTGSYGVNVFGYDFYKGTHRARRRPRARARPGARRLSSADRRERAAHQGDFRARRSVVPHVGHRSRDAGGAAGALSHPAHPPGALLRRLSRLVGRRAAGHRQSAACARDLYACGNVRGNAARAAHAARHRLRAGQSGAGACTRTRRRRRDSSLLDSSRSSHFDKAAYTDWLKRLRQVCSERNIVLIFDEVFVGFRLAPGGAQEYFGVRADLVTYGKTIGGGLPIGVVCGRKDLMKRFRDDRPADICFARGTFNAHPYVMAAMNEFLRQFQTAGGAGALPRPRCGLGWQGAAAEPAACR